MRLLQARELFRIIAGVLLSSCADSVAAPVEPLAGATPVAVSLVGTGGISLFGLPRFQVSGLSEAVQVTWEVEDGPCLLFEASAKRAGSVVQIEIRRSGNPLANCANVRVAHRYVARVDGLSPGPFEIRLTDRWPERSSTLMGRRTVVVLPRR